MVNLKLGFASFQDGTFELIINSRDLGSEVTLTGLMEGNPSFEKIDELLPTCVYVPAEAPELPPGWFSMICEATEKLVPEDSYVNHDTGQLLELVGQIADPARDDDCKLYLFTQTQLLTLVLALTQPKAAN